MRRFVIAGFALLAACNPAPKVDNKNAEINESAPARPLAPQPVTLKAVDGVTVYGTFYPASEPKALILLFHQAGSSSGEYATIAPRLAQAGYESLAIDQRAGGNLYGVNRTMAGYTGKTDYLGALPDMEAALAWAKGRTLPVVLWGSSYSASLVFLLANARDAQGKVKAVIAFSPGEYFDDKKMVEAAAAKVSLPVFVTSANSTEEEGDAKAILTATKSTDRQLYVPMTGIHGSSTLIAGKNPGGAEENWCAVMGFLKRIFP